MALTEPIFFLQIASKVWAGAKKYKLSFLLYAGPLREMPRKEHDSVTSKPFRKLLDKRTDGLEGK